MAVQGSASAGSMAAPETKPGGAGGLAALVIAVVLALLGGVACAQPTPQPSSGPTGQASWLRQGFPTGPVGVVGLAAYQMLDVGALNAEIDRWNQSNGADPDLPRLPSAGYAPGFGVFIGLTPRLAFATAGSELNVERREKDAFSRLRINDTQVGLYYVARQGARWRLLVGGLVGLASVEFEGAVRSSGCQPQGLADYTCLRGSRWSRLMLSLQPEIAVQLALTDSAGLLISAGYLVASDFWNPEWAHGMGSTVRGRPEAFSGPLLKFSLMVGTL